MNHVVYHVNQRGTRSLKVTWQKSQDAILVDVAILKFKSFDKAGFVNAFVGDKMFRGLLKGSARAAEDYIHIVGMV